MCLLQLHDHNYITSNHAHVLLEIDIIICNRLIQFIKYATYWLIIDESFMTVTLPIDPYCPGNILVIVPVLISSVGCMQSTPLVVAGSTAHATGT